MNTDKQCFDKVKRNLTSFTSKYEKELSQNSIYPLDNEVIKLISDINLREEDDDFAIYRYQKNIKKIWKLLIQKSIICLRYFDTREPFQEKNKKIPYAYGVNELSDYFRFLSVRLNRLKNKLLANYLRNRGNDLATVRNSAFCVAILSNNSFICKYNIFFRKYELSVAIL